MAKILNIRLINSFARTELSLFVKPIQKKLYRTSGYVPARTAPSVPDRPFQKPYRASRHASASPASSARHMPVSPARHVAVSPLAQALGHSEPRSMLELAIKLSKKIRGYTKGELMEVQKELVQYCPDVLKMVRLL